MINLRQMQRLLASGYSGQHHAFERVVEQILSNGRCHCPAVRQALLGSPAVQTVAMGLALQRCCELAYGQTPLGCDLAHRLARERDADGLFEKDIAATAIAARGLLDWVDLPGEVHDEVSIRCQSAIVALAECQNASGLLGGDVVASAIVMWQLGDRPELCEAFGEVHWRKLAAAVRRGGGDVSEEFSRFAFAMAA